jgi:microcystin-dependent protein
MDFLKQNNFRYIVIIIIIILAVINLCKVNSQENFIVLDDDQDIGTHTVRINSTDQVMFGSKTLTQKLKNIESGLLTLGTFPPGPTGPPGILDGANGLHLRSNRDVFLMSPPKSATRVSKEWGNSGKLVVEGSAHFRDGAFFEGEVHSTTDSNEGGRIALINPSKSATGEVSKWTIYNMTGDYKPNGLHFWKYPTDAWKDSGSTFVLADDGSTLVKGELGIQSTLRKTRANNQNLNIVSDKTLYLLGKENVHIYKCDPNIPNNCEHWDGASGNLIVDGHTLLKGELGIQTTIRKTRANNQNLHLVSDKILYLMAKENVHIYKCNPNNQDNCEYWDGASGNLIVDGNLTVNGSNNIMPELSVISYAGSVVPAGWQLCDGNYLRYSDGTVINDGTPKYANLRKSGTTVHTPDLRGRFILGSGKAGENNNNSYKGDSDGKDAGYGGEVYTNGGTGGCQKQQLSVAQMPSHDHNIATGQNGGATLNAVERFHVATIARPNNPGIVKHTGGNTPHTNMPPYYILTYIIKQPSS